MQGTIPHTDPMGTDSSLLKFSSHLQFDFCHCHNVQMSFKVFERYFNNCCDIQTDAFHVCMSYIYIFRYVLTYIFDCGGILASPQAIQRGSSGGFSSPFLVG